MSRRKSNDVQRLEKILEKITTGEYGRDNSEKALNQFKECADLESLINRLIECTNFAKEALKASTKEFAWPNHPELKFIRVEAGSQAKEIYSKLLDYRTKNDVHKEIVENIREALETVKNSFWVPVGNTSLIGKHLKVRDPQLDYDYKYGHMEEFSLFLGTIALDLIADGWCIADALNKSIDTYPIVMEQKYYIDNDEDLDEDSMKLYIMSTKTFDFSFEEEYLEFTEKIPPKFYFPDGTYEYPDRYRNYGWLIIQ